jgi:porin
MPALGRIVTCCAAVALAWLPLSAAAADPSWYGDVQYLTWDVRADEAEAARASNPDGEVYLQPSEAERDLGWYESCAYRSGGGMMCGVSEWESRIACLCIQMKESGIAYNVFVPQFYQGVASGGIEQTFEYGGKVDQFVTLDSGKLGLWNGMIVSLHAETRYGQDVNQEAVGLAPVNVAMLYPNAEEHDTAITNLTFAQSVDDDWQVVFGKFNGLDMFYMLYPQTGRGVNGFMQTSVVIPLAVARVFPLSFLGAGITKLKDGKVQGSLTVYDPHDCTTTTGFDQLGDNGANIMGLWRFFTEPNGLAGSHGFAFIGATGDYTSLDPAGFVFVPGQGVIATQQTGSWAALYVLEQQLWRDGCNPARNVGLLSQWCIADEETSPFQWTGNVAVQVNGFFAERPSDSAGVAYFYTGLSSEFENLVSPVVDLQDLHGVELYYNAAMSSCSFLTADLQAIEPANVGQETALVLGLRGTIVR